MATTRIEKSFLGDFNASAKMFTFFYDAAWR